MGCEKTVYILGAGFSVPAGLPPQSAILSKVFNSSEDFLTENELLFNTRIEYNKARMNIARFLIQMFSSTSEMDILETLNPMISEKTPEVVKKYSENRTLIDYVAKNLSYVSLEDIFTIIDKAILTGENVHNYKTEELYRLRENLVLCILRIFTETSLQHLFDNQSYQTFVDHLIKLRLKQPEKDPLAVITLNWDSILDTYLSRTIKALGDTKVRIDYCIYDYDYESCYLDPTKKWCPSLN